MKVIDVIQATVTQAEFAELVGVSPGAVSGMFKDGHLDRGASCHGWLMAYCGRLREQAAGRMGADAGGLGLVQERALLAREQRIGYEMKNAAMRGEFAPISLLSQVLATASQAVAERLEYLPVTLKRHCPELTHHQMGVITAHIAEARNEWVRATLKLVVTAVFPDEDELLLDDSDEADELLDSGLAHSAQ